MSAVIKMLDEETISELKILENPKFPYYITKALEDRAFLEDIVKNLTAQDWVLRWGVSRVLVQVSKRKPELLKEYIPTLLSALNEKKRNVHNNIAQTLLHLSKGIPEDLIKTEAVERCLNALKEGDDFEKYDALKMLEYLTPVDPFIVKSHLKELQKIANDYDNPVVKGEAERVMKALKKYM